MVRDTSATRSSAPPIDAGEVEATIGRYRVLGVLGRGGMGVVYSGHDDLLRRRVAIKWINHRSLDAASRRRSLREAQAMAMLDHPNIVRVYEVLEVEAHLCIVMEFVPGRTLRRWLGETRPPRAEVLAALIQAGRGIAAAHAVGLVHRDLKPDNVMIDDDGRVRVMDFGLARVIDSDLDGQGGEVTGAEGLARRQTRFTGAFIGTLGYAAPEQELGSSADESSDVFSFCVLAFEALHGRRPFVGDDSAELLATMVAGRITPHDDDVPDWLDAVVRRGLEAEPHERWPTMDALLAALADDPLVRRRRRRRLLAGLVLAGGAVALAIQLGSMVRDAAAQARREVVAEARLRTVEGVIARAEAEGDPTTAEVAFRTFVTDPEHRRTRALVRAWLDRGDHRAADPPAATTAYAEAYVHASSLADERAALRRLATIFLRERDGVGLGRSVDLLQARGADEPELAELAFQAALWRGDLPAAAGELALAGHPHGDWRGLLDHLAQARATHRSIVDLTPLPPGGPARFAVVDPSGMQVALLDGSLQEVGRLRGASPVSLLPRTTWVLARDEHELRVVDVLTGEVLGHDAPTIAPVAPFDATGDGVPELFFGRRWPLYGFSRWDGLGVTDAHVRDAHPETDASDSTFDAHVVGDLDGDGQDELAIGLGPWRSFELRVYQPDARGELELVAARQVGRIGGLALVDRGPRRLLAALVDDSCPAPDVFPEPPHTGGPPGVHLFEWTGGDLIEVEFVPLPGADDLGRFVGWVREAVGDLDGDGRQDLAFSLGRDGQPWLLILRQTATGFAPLLVAGLRLFAGDQLDADAPLELLVTNPPGQELFVLGLAGAATPHTAQDLPGPPALPSALLGDPWLVERWNRAADLDSLALTDSAAESLRETALLAGERAAKSALLDRAGELLAARDRLFEVLALDPDAHDDPEVRDRARTRRLSALVRVGRHEDALAEAQAVLRAGTDGPAALRLARTLADELPALLDPRARIDLGFAQPLTHHWQIHVPGALRRDLQRAALSFAIPALEAPVAELAIDWQGGPIALEVELDVERLEFGAGIDVGLVDRRGERWFAAGYSGQGGGGRLHHADWLKVGRNGWAARDVLDVASGIHPRRIHVSMTYSPAHGTVDLVHTSGSDVWLARWLLTTPPEPGVHRLVIGSFVDSRQDSLALGDLRRIVVRGARLVEPSPAAVARDRPARLLAEHEPRAALQALADAGTPIPGDAALRLHALAELGDYVGIVGVSPAVLALTGDPTVLGAVTLALRREAVAAAALRSSAGAALLPLLRSVWALAGPHREDPAIRSEALDALQEIERLVPATDDEREALRELLATRAQLWRHSGQPERASRDDEAAAALARPRPSE